MLALAVHIVHQNILAESFGRGVEGAALVDGGHLVDEIGQDRSCVRA